MRCKDESNDNEVSIELAGTKGKQKKYMQAFQECKEGRCTCPTREYSKLESLVIESEKDTIVLKLKAKPDVKFEESEIGKCLEHIRCKVKGEG